MCQRHNGETNAVGTAAAKDPRGIYLPRRFVEYPSSDLAAATEGSVYMRFPELASCWIAHLN